MKKLFMLAKPDREDQWFFEHSAISFEVPQGIVTFRDAYNFTKGSIEKCVEWIIEEACLKYDLFKGQEYKFIRTSFANYVVEFEFELANGDIIFYWVKPAFITLYSEQ